MSWNLHQDSDLGPLAAVWSAAVQGASQGVFQSFAFARHWAVCFGQEAEMCIGWRREPPLLLPLVCRGGCWSFLGEGLFDYQDPVGVAGPEVQTAAAEWVATRVAGTVRITGVPATTGWPVFWSGLPWRPAPFAAVPLRGCGRDGLATEHPRTERRWCAAGVELRPVHEAHERRLVLDWLLEHKQRNLAAHEQRSVLGPPECRWLLAMVEHEAHQTELWQLRRGNDTLAGLLCWVSPAMRYAYTISYDATFAALSPGVLALYALLRHTMREGRSFNFLTGEQAFKQRFATDRELLQRYTNDYGNAQS
ncbi:MAG: GNAT family N-acetyltransferase [Terriglobales bacterium]